MGKIPASTNMISAMILNPQAGKTVTAGTTFNISVQTTHLNAGNFVNPTTNYYTAPQDLDANGDIIGHCHVTVQDIGSLDSTTPPDPTRFAFFKGIDDAGNGQGLLQAVVSGGLPVGVYRVCTIIAAQNHQPVAMPVAQRGAQDDCTKFEVVAAQGNQQNGNQGNQGQQNQGQQNGNQANQGNQGNQASQGQQNGNQANQGQQNQGQQNGNQANQGQQNGNQANQGQQNGNQANQAPQNGTQAGQGQQNQNQRGQFGKGRKGKGPGRAFRRPAQRGKRTLFQ